MKAFVVLNPVAGNNSREQVLEALKTHFNDARIDYVVHETEKKDKLGDIVRDRLEHEKFDFVVAAGGDGTASQVAEGLIGRNLPMGIIPVGTGNLLARDLALPLKFDEAIALIAGTHALKKIDAMRINNHICVLNASLGLSAKVMRDTTSESKNRFGVLAYMWETLVKLFKMKRRCVTAHIDGNTTKHLAFEIAFFNCGIIAETLYPKGPHISIDDGQLDVWFIGIKTILDYPLYLYRTIRNKSSKNFTHFMKANKCVMIESSNPMPLQVDGEFIGTTPVEIEVLPGAITIFVSENPDISS